MNPNPSEEQPAPAQPSQLSTSEAADTSVVPGVVVAAPPAVSPSQVVVAPPIEPKNLKTSPGTAYFEMSAQFGTSPYPPAPMLREYNDAVPGLGDRLIEWVEAESKHRRTLEAKQAQAEIDDMREQRSIPRRGQAFGFAIGVIAILAGSITSIWGAPWAGGFIGTAGVIGLVSVFAGRREIEKREAAKTEK